MNKEKNTIQVYLDAISAKYAHEETSEMGYRTDFELLLKGIFESIKVTRFDHDARAKEGNKPDFVVIKNSVPILYIETKDIGVSLDKVAKSEQMTRYFGYANLVLTDYTEFRFYRNGIRYVEPIIIATYEVNTRTIHPHPEAFENLAKTLIDFTQSHKEPIRSGAHLAKVMGGKAQRIRDNIRRFLNNQSSNNVQLLKVYETIKKLLVHDLDTESFSDMYAQTLVYGLFVARFYDETQSTFSRQEARDLIPKSNPLLQHFFDHILGTNFDDRLEHIVSELCEVFSHADVEKLMQEYYEKDLFGNEHKGPDPVIHFYEDFLSEYDPALRKKMGAYYTPLPVVEFIVRSVDEILKKEFDLPKGLAETAKLPNGKHRVQVLDPATGTGTFISAVIGHIYKSFVGQEGRWYPYVLHDLLPRIHGFELMMAPYTIAHLKLGLAFKKTGFKYFNDRRLGIYLTNSLEEADVQKDLYGDIGFAGSIASESKAASVIKTQTPIMVVIGNPPYSVSSSNKGEWIQNLIKDYKKDLHERKNNLDDDYIKFIRFSEYFIEKNKNGIVAMITNNSFIDGITHRQMRKHLLETFDDIYILDLHGNSKKKEKAPDGDKDENVFNIQQGVSINIFVKNTIEKKGLGRVHHADMYGKKADKYELLTKNDIKGIKWQMLNYSEPNYFFVPKDFELEDEYQNGFKISDLMPLYNSGIQTKNDEMAVKIDKSFFETILRDFSELPVNELKTKYNRKESSGWNFENAKKDLNLDHQIIKYQYRPFDYRWICYTGRSGGFIGRSRSIVMKHFLKSNLGLLLMKQFFQQIHYNHVLVTDSMIDERTLYSNRGGTYLYPLYLYSADGSRVPNFDEDMVTKIEKTIGKAAPEDIFDYIYAVLYSPKYREKYEEFLKIDFPRVPYPRDKKVFQELAKLGEELRELHLLESPKLDNFITTYPVPGSNMVEVIKRTEGKVFINDTQYFGGVPDVAWNFWIGGYQPAQKWLKDRKRKVLTNEDIEHYQKMIVALTETDKVMREIDKINFF